MSSSRGGKTFATTVATNGGVVCTGSSGGIITNSFNTSSGLPSGTGTRRRKRRAKQETSHVHLPARSIGSTIVITDGEVIVDGKEVDYEDARNIHIHITGDAGRMNIDSAATISVEGNAQDIHLGAGSVNITGSCASIETASGSVEVGESVHGRVSTITGFILANEITGSCSTKTGRISGRN